MQKGKERSGIFYELFAKSAYGLDKVVLLFGRNSVGIIGRSDDKHRMLGNPYTRGNSAPGIPTLFCVPFSSP